MNKTIKKEKLREFVEKNHWLICDCDIEDMQGEECRMKAILPSVEEAFDKMYDAGRKDERERAERVLTQIDLDKLNN